MNKKLQPAVIWITGLSASGKTTIALSLMEEFVRQNAAPQLLDGDEVRKKMGLNAFDKASRKKYNLEVGRIAARLEKEGTIVIVSLISPYKDVRVAIRKKCTRFIEVYLSTNISTCIERDPKGLYKKALNGEIGNFTGISAPYEIPEFPEVVLDTASLDIEECRNSIMHYYWSLSQMASPPDEMRILP